MVDVVITGHGAFASGLKSMLEMVMGEIEQSHFIDFKDTMSSEDLNAKFSSLIKSTNGEIIFLCDLAGGTPFNQACLAMNNAGYKHGVIGGVNIALIFEVIGLREEQTDLQVLSLQAKEAGQQAIVLFEDLKKAKAVPSSGNDDGGI